MSIETNADFIQDLSSIEDDLSSLQSSLSSLKSTVSTNTTNISKKTVYSDFAVSQTSTYSLSNGNGGSASHSVTITKSGYYPLGIVGHTSTSTNHYNNTEMGACITNIYLSNRASGSCTLNCTTFVADNYSWTYSSTYSAFILWVKVR